MEENIKYTQAEYDAEMKKLNDAQQKEIAPLQRKLRDLHEDRTQLKQNELRIKASLEECNSESYKICGQIQDIKQKYNEKRSNVYLKRPINEN